MSGKLFVVGAGLMGAGIAQVAATSGWEVTLRDLDQPSLDRARTAIEGSLEKFVSKSRITAEQRDETLGRISGTTELDAAADADIVVEAVFESIDVKQKVFVQLDDVAGQNTVLASNTSALPITTIAAVTKRPERVVGTHFFSPVPMMELVELVRGVLTSDETLSTAQNFARSLGKRTITVERDVAGFVTTRLIAALVVEAVKLYESGVASAEDIDLACKLGFGHAMGPLATADLTGLDVLQHATENIYAESRDAKFAAPELMARMVEAGLLGRKSGHGFYDYGS